MKSEMAKRLKEILANTTQEEFNKEWAEIEAMGFEGPDAFTVLKVLTVNLISTGEYTIENVVAGSSFSTDENFTLAA